VLSDTDKAEKVSDKKTKSVSTPASRMVINHEIRQMRQE
jgi:hypothetical protein